MCTGFDVQTRSSARAFIGAEVNLLIASSVPGNGALFEKGVGLDNEPATNKARRIYDVVANRDRIAYVIGITRELISLSILRLATIDSLPTNNDPGIPSRKRQLIYARLVLVDEGKSFLIILESLMLGWGGIHEDVSFAGNLDIYEFKILDETYIGSKKSRMYVSIES